MADTFESVFGPVISSYSRADAFRDGVLIDASGMAREAGFKFPVAVTRAAWDKCVTVPPGVEGQDEKGRAWDALWMLRCAIHRGTGGSQVAFEVKVRTGYRKSEIVKLKSICGPGDDGEPVITVLLPTED